MVSDPSLPVYDTSQKWHSLEPGAFNQGQGLGFDFSWHWAALTLPQGVCTEKPPRACACAIRIPASTGCAQGPSKAILFSEVA